MRYLQHIYTRCKVSINSGSQGYGSAAISDGLRNSMSVIECRNFKYTREVCDGVGIGEPIICVTVSDNEKYACVSMATHPTKRFDLCGNCMSVIFTHQLIAPVNEFFNAPSEEYCFPLQSRRSKVFRTQYNEVEEGDSLPELIIDKSTEFDPRVIKSYISENAFYRFIEALLTLADNPAKKICLVFDDVDSVEECTDRACTIMTVGYQILPIKFRKNIRFVSFWHSTASNSNVVFSYEKAFDTLGQTKNIIINSSVEDYEPLMYSKEIWQALNANSQEETEKLLIDLLNNKHSQLEKMRDIVEAFELDALIRKEIPYSPQEFKIVLEYLNRVDLDLSADYYDNVYIRILEAYAGNIVQDNQMLYMISDILCKRADTKSEYEKVNAIRQIFPNCICSCYNGKVTITELGDCDRGITADKIIKNLKAYDGMLLDVFVHLHDIDIKIAIISLLASSQSTKIELKDYMKNKGGLLQDLNTDLSDETMESLYNMANVLKTKNNSPKVDDYIEEILFRINKLSCTSFLIAATIINKKSDIINKMVKNGCFKSREDIIGLLSGLIKIIETDDAKKNNAKIVVEELFGILYELHKEGAYYVCFETIPDTKYESLAEFIYKNSTQKIDLIIDLIDLLVQCEDKVPETISLNNLIVQLYESDKKTKKKKDVLKRLLTSNNISVLYKCCIISSIEGQTEKQYQNLVSEMLNSDIIHEIEMADDNNKNILLQAFCETLNNKSAGDAITSTPNLRIGKDTFILYLLYCFIKNTNPSTNLYMDKGTVDCVERLVIDNREFLTVKHEMPRSMGNVHRFFKKVRKGLSREQEKKVNMPFCILILIAIGLAVAVLAISIISKHNHEAIFDSDTVTDGNGTGSAGINLSDNTGDHNVTNASDYTGNFDDANSSDDADKSDDVNCSDDTDKSDDVNYSDDTDKSGDVNQSDNTDLFYNITD